MADDEFEATGNWWDSSSSRNVRFEAPPPPPPPPPPPSSHSSSFPNSNFTWQQLDHHDLKPSSNISFSHSSPTTMIMGLGLSSNPIHWNNHHHNLLRAAEKGAADGRFRSMFQENNLSSSGGSSCGNNNNFQQVEWREKLFFSTDSSSTATTDQYSTTSGDSIVTTSHGLASSFNMDSSAANPSSLLQGLLLPPEASSSSSSSTFDNHHQNNRSCFSFPYNTDDHLMPSWPKVSQFLRASSSPPKQTQHHGGGNSQLQFTNNTTFWNASEPNNHHHHHHAAIKEASRASSFFPNSFQPPFHHSPNFDAQSKNICGGRETNSSVGKKSGEAAPKRARNETSSTLPPFKVRKEKMGDRITALQQLVSPFGKTDTASVLSEAIEYIKFLHEQVSVLSTPYMKTGAPLQHQQSSGKCKEAGETIKQDLRSRGLCLVPVSSTFPVTHETTVDFWMPTFGATFR